MSGVPSKGTAADRKLHKKLREAAKRLSQQVETMTFAEPVTHVYNPLQYAWRLHESYISRVHATADVLILGMNPGPWGMAQTGVPFGEISAVRDWMRIQGDVEKPEHQHPKRPVEGLDCPRSEVSGRRLWGLMRERFADPDDFFQKHFVLNYCPLVFMEASGRNRTPDKLPARENEILRAACDEHLREVTALLPWKHLVGVGAFAEACFRRVCDPDSSASICRILHPSPASPAANRDWAGTATKQLQKAGVW